MNYRIEFTELGGKSFVGVWSSYEDALRAAEISMAYRRERGELWKSTGKGRWKDGLGGHIKVVEA